MSLITKSIPNFYGGVSQQSKTQRKENQMSIMENAHATVVDGLMKRPHTDFIALLTSSAENGAMIHGINRDEEEKYIVIITGEESEPIEIFTTEGVKCTVQYGTLDEDLVFVEDTNVKDYVTTTNATISPNNQWKAVTVADYTFIVNTQAYANFKAATVTGSVTGVVQTFSDLPTDPAPVTGDIYEITGDDSSKFNSYYVIYTSDGYWQETIKPGVKYQLNESLMPHRLVRTAENTFTFAPCIWSDRRVGDDLSQPYPSFIGRRIQNIFFFRNRLGFLSDDNIYLSRTAKYFDMFIKTALDVLDDDPIDVSAASTQVSTLRSVVAYDKDLLVFSDEQQFHFGSGGSATLTPKTAAFTPTTHYRIESTSQPIAAGPNVYFPCPREQYTTIREYLIQPDSLTEDAADVTAHVPSYIPMGHIQMAGCSSLDILFVHSDADPNVIYVYKYFWLGTEKAQSSWYRWTFGEPILACVVMGSTLYMIVKRNEVGMEKIELEKVKSGDLNFRVHLDQQVALPGSYNAFTDLTYFSLPYTPVSLEGTVGGIDRNTILCIQSNNPSKTGVIVPGNDEYTKLLIHSDEEFYSTTLTDSSAEEQTITNPDDAVQHKPTFHKFGQSAIHCEQSTSSNMPRLTNSALFTIGTQDFCLDYWIYINSDEDWVDDYSHHWGNYGIYPLEIVDDAYYRNIGFYHSPNGQGRCVFRYVNTTGGQGSFALAEDSVIGGPIPKKSWTHFAIYRVSNQVYIARNGVVTATAEFGTNMTNWTDRDVYLFQNGRIGGLDPENNVWMDELRWSLGHGRYPGSLILGTKVFTPNLAAYDAAPTYYSTDFSDSSVRNHSVTGINNAIHDDTVYKFPSSSINVSDGLTTALQIPNDNDWEFGEADFTIDFRMYLNTLTLGTLMEYGGEEGKYSWKASYTSESISFSYSADGTNWIGVTWTEELNIAQWYHIAFVRKDGVLTLYVDGATLGDKSFDYTIRDNGGDLFIGGDGWSSGIDGYLEEVRISNIARWTGPFYPPFASYNDVIFGIYSSVDGATGYESMIAKWFGIWGVNPVTGEELLGAFLDGQTIAAPGNHEDGNDYLFGRDYAMDVELTPPIMRDSQNNSIISGRLQLRNLSIAHNNTGHYQLIIHPKGRAPVVHTFDAVDFQDALLQTDNAVSAVSKNAILTDASKVQIKIYSIHYKPVELQSGSFQATFTTKAGIL